VLLEDSAFLRDVISEWVVRQPDLELVGSYGSCREIEAASAEWRDVVALIIVDLGLPDGDGIDTWRTLCAAAGRAIPVLVFSGRASLDDVRRVQAGAKTGIAVLSKDSAVSIQTVRQGIDAALAGMMMVDPSIAARHMSAAVRDRLNDQELSVLACIAEGLSNQAIHERLFTSVKRIEALVTTIYDKLGLGRSTGDQNPRVVATLMFLGLVLPN
jgi:DNA-binding NarL/FixJ family response regulator